MTDEHDSSPAGPPCRGCSSVRTTEVVDLGIVPASDWFPLIDDPGEDPRWALRLIFCQDCRLAQLGPDVFPTPEPPRALESETSRLHAKESAIEVIRTEGLMPGDSIIELDSHHGGSWLGGFIDGEGPQPRRIWHPKSSEPSSTRHHPSADEGRGSLPWQIVKGCPARRSKGRFPRNEQLRRRTCGRIAPFGPRAAME